jgi:hypothetical protein
MDLGSGNQPFSNLPDGSDVHARKRGTLMQCSAFVLGKCEQMLSVARKVSERETDNCGKLSKSHGKSLQLPLESPLVQLYGSGVCCAAVQPELSDESRIPCAIA